MTSTTLSKRLIVASGVVAAVGVLVLLVIAAIDVRMFFHAYLVGYLFWLGVALGSLIWLMIHHLTGGHWGWSLRRPAEVIITTLPWFALGFVPLIFGMSYLYPWAQLTPEHMNPIMEHQRLWLNLPLILLRAVIYFGVWIGFSHLLLRPAARVSHAQPASAIGMMLMFLTVTFASIDWLLAIEAKAFTSVWGFYVGVGFASAGLAVMLWMANWRWRGVQPAELNEAQKTLFRDFGNLLLACVVLHAYMDYSQFFITWAGNTQAEIGWYVTREQGMWGVLGVVLIGVYFFLPFGALLFRFIKHHPRLLLGVCVVMMVAQALSLMWMVLPGMNEHGQWELGLISMLMSMVAIAAFGGLFVLLVTCKWATLSEPQRPRTSLQVVNDSHPQASQNNQVLS